MYWIFMGSSFRRIVYIYELDSLETSASYSPLFRNQDFETKTGRGYSSSDNLAANASSNAVAECLAGESNLDTVIRGFADSVGHGCRLRFRWTEIST